MSPNAPDMDDEVEAAEAAARRPRGLRLATKAERKAQRAPARRKAQPLHEPVLVDLVERPVPGTHYTFLGVTDFADAMHLTPAQRVEVARRINAVGPKVPRYGRKPPEQTVGSKLLPLVDEEGMINPAAEDSANEDNQSNQGDTVMSNAAKVRKSAPKKSAKAAGVGHVTTEQKDLMQKVGDGALATMAKAGKLDPQLLKGSKKKAAKSAPAAKGAVAKKSAPNADTSKYVIVTNNAKNGFAKQFFDALVAAVGKKAFTREQAIEATKKAITEARARSYVQFYIGNGKFKRA